MTVHLFALCFDAYAPFDLVQFWSRSSGLGRLSATPAVSSRSLPNDHIASGCEFFPATRRTPRFARAAVRLRNAIKRR